MKKYFRHWVLNVRFWRYVIVGGGGTLWDVGVYALLRNLGMGHWLSLTISFGTGVLIGFYLTRKWVFESQEVRWHGQLVRFLLVIGLIYFLNGLVMEGLYMVLPAMRWRAAVARGFAALGTFPVSFVLHKRISFP
ncbi:MAG: GtrA family protein [Bacteroidia bacterium]|nr:GtrA family protein [Bacteroidia bacterium]MDW8134356.1 GtrA family protein [Bacteroidia bacterium]